MTVFHSRRATSITTSFTPRTEAAYQYVPGTARKARGIFTSLTCILLNSTRVAAVDSVTKRGGRGGHQLLWLTVSFPPTWEI